MQSIIRSILFTAGCLTTCVAFGGAPQRLGERTPLKPPFCQIFDDYAAGSEYDLFDRYYQIINADGDKNPSGSDRSWGLYNFNGESNGRQFSKCAYLQYPLEKKVCDDWLIPWAIKLEGGKYYYVSVDASLYLASGAHSFEIKMGEYNDAQGLDVTVVPPTDITSIIPTRCGGWFSPEFDGLYYMGIHGISTKARSEGNYLFMDNISMEAARSGSEPSEVTDVNFVSFSNGEPGATISFNAPAVSIDKTALSGNVTVKIARNGSLIKTLTLSPGEKVSFEDAVAKADTYTYSFTCSNSEGTGIEYKVNKYIGLTAPQAPVVTSISEPERGKVALSWTAPETDLNGEIIDPASLRYNIYEVTNNDIVLRKGMHEGTDFIYDFNLPAGKQEIAMMAVTAVIGDDMESERAVSDYIFIGDPHQLPYAISFGDTDTGECLIGADADEGVSWRTLDEFSDPKPQDDDHGYIAMIATAPGQKGEVSTGKLDFSDASDPYLDLYVYNYEDDSNVFSVYIYDYETDKRTVVESFPLLELPEIGWCEVKVPLSGFEGKMVRVIIGAEIVTHGYFPLDNITIAEMPAVDLAVKVTDYSSYASLGDPFAVEAEVFNYGYETVGSFTASLLQDGVEIDSTTGGRLGSFESTTVVFTGEFTASAPANSVFTVVVAAEGDKNESNNTSDPFNITFIAPLHPVATDLQIAEDASDVVLTWKAPDLSKAAPEAATEDFESYPAFTTQLEGFSMIDADGGLITGFSGVDNFPMTGTSQAFWTQRCEYPYEYLYTSGQSSLFCMATVNEGRRPIPNDDWLISPELFGGRQTISFRAVSQTIQYGYETFEVYASSTGKEISDFSKIMLETKVPAEWTDYYVTLPEGSRYFAVRCTSNDCMMLALDDFSYIPEGTPRNLELKGYRVYRNGKRLTSDLLTETTFRTPNLDRDDTYFVTAVYKEGESIASNLVSLNGSGVVGIAADESAPEIYYDLNGLRVDADRLTPGIYIRTRGTVAEKVVIR